MKKTKLRAFIYVLICVILWALIPVVAKLGQSSLNNHQFLFWSSVVSFLTFLIILVFKKQIRNIAYIPLKSLGFIMFLGFLGTYLYYILLYFGYAEAQGIEVLVLQYSWPIFIVILSIFILREKLTYKRIFSVILGFIGVLIVITKGNIANIHLENIKVDILIVIAAISFALFSVLSKRINTEPFLMLFIYFFTALLASGISMFCLSEFSLPTKYEVFPIIVNGIFVNGLSYLFWIKALKESEASFIAPFVFLTPVIAAIFLIVFFDEPVYPVYLIGLFAVIISGLINIERKKKIA